MTTMMLVQPDVDGEARTWDVHDVPIDVVEDEPSWWRCADGEVDDRAWRLAGADSTTWSE